MPARRTKLSEVSEYFTAIDPKLKCFSGNQSNEFETGFLFLRNKLETKDTLRKMLMLLSCKKK